MRITLTLGVTGARALGRVRALGSLGRRSSKKLTKLIGQGNLRGGRGAGDLAEGSKDEILGCCALDLDLSLCR